MTIPIITVKDEPYRHVLRIIDAVPKEFRRRWSAALNPFCVLEMPDTDYLGALEWAKMMFDPGDAVLVVPERHAPAFREALPSCSIWFYEHCGADNGYLMHKYRNPDELRGGSWAFARRRLKYLKYLKAREAGLVDPPGCPPDCPHRPVLDPDAATRAGVPLDTPAPVEPCPYAGATPWTHREPTARKRRNRR